MRGIFIRVLLEKISLICEVPGTMHQAFFWLVIRLLGCPAYSFLWLMARNLSGLVWEVDYPPLHSYYYWHGWYLPYGWWFLKVFLLCKLVIPLPCAQTCCMFPCRYLLQITILSGSTVSPSHWERNAEGSCWVIQVPSSWNNSKRKILVNSYLVPLVVQWIYLIGGAKVFS